MHGYTRGFFRNNFRGAFSGVKFDFLILSFKLGFLGGPNVIFLRIFSQEQELPGL